MLKKGSTKAILRVVGQPLLQLQKDVAVIDELKGVILRQLGRIIGLSRGRCLSKVKT